MDEWERRHQELDELNRATMRLSICSFVISGVGILFSLFTILRVVL